MRSPARFAAFAWVHLLALIGVILFGAWVRITHSGAGCGAHWPLCDGEVIPFEASTEKLIEYTHRLTSGALGLLSLGLLPWAFVARVERRVRVAAVVTFVFVMIEAAVGAGLVLGELVADDASVARAIVIALHLVNTLVLTGAASLCAFWASPGRETGGRFGGPLGWSVAAGVVGVGMSGAITALGDTLFPPGALAAADAGHFLVQLRIVHPLLAVLLAGALLAYGARVRARSSEDAATARRALGLQLLVGAQVIAGVATIALAAPGFMQIVHLLLAQILWIQLVLLLGGLPTAAPRSRARQPLGLRQSPKMPSPRSGSDHLAFFSAASSFLISFIFVA